VISVIEFHGDPWTVPNPNIYGNGQVPLEVRYVWYGLLHITDYPVFASDITETIEALGYDLHVNKVAHIMSRLCGCGYFSREKTYFPGKGPYYRYMPTELFLRVQRKHLEAR
jgi:hypothetical protein